MGIVEILADEYKAVIIPDITINGKRPSLKVNYYNKKLIEILNDRNYISKYSKEKKGFRIATYWTTPE